jgi:hypothetical protein
MSAAALGGGGGGGGAPKKAVHVKVCCLDEKMRSMTCPGESGIVAYDWDEDRNRTWSSSSKEPTHAHKKARENVLLRESL